MNRIFVPTAGASDWRRFVAAPSSHWKRRRSAYELAVSWEVARKLSRGLPARVCELCDDYPRLSGASLVFAFPEHQVELDGGGHASQADLWALLRVRDELVSLAVEGKAGEPFDKTVAEWLASASARSGKPARLSQLRTLLGLEDTILDGVRYQLLHRCATALLEARRLALESACLLVQSFATDPRTFADYQAFCQLLCVEGVRNKIIDGPMLHGVQLSLEWVCCDPASAEDLEAAV